MEGRILTVGYGNRSTEEFFALLRLHRVQFLIDVRSQPLVAHNPDFGRPSLRPIAKRHYVVYVFMGDALGGRPRDGRYYADGRVDYQLLAGSADFQHGLSRLTKAVNMGFVVCLMCSELRPENCHRSKLVGEELARIGVPPCHIDADGRTQTHDDVRKRFVGGQQLLFDEPLTSAGRYEPPPHE